MKKQIFGLALAAITAVGFGAAQMPALADDFHDHWDRHDINHDGRWDRNEFHTANVYYGKHHPEWHERYARHDSDRAFRRLDTDHHGYLTQENVRTYHHF
jgi:hypothetical protein